MLKMFGTAVGNGIVFISFFRALHHLCAAKVRISVVVVLVVQLPVVVAWWFYLILCVHVCTL